MRVHEAGGRLSADEVPVPVPGPGEALIRVRAAGVNFADTLLVAGRYQERPAFPFAPGLEVVGTVEAGGALPRGTRVAALTGRGGFAEFALAPAALCLPLPDDMPDEIAAGFLVAYGSSEMALSHRAGLLAGETLLVTGAAGGVGLTAVEIGKLMGARVIAAARGAAKLETARAAGADLLLDSEVADLAAAVKALGGADVVYETVGGASFAAALRAAKPGGRLLPIGFAGGEVPRIPADYLLVKNLSVIGFWLSAWARLDPAALAASFARLFGWWREGRLRPHVSDVLPLGEAETALDLLRRRAATGKVALRVAPEVAD